MARRRAAKTIDELLAQARATLPDRPSPAEALHAQASGALLIDIREDDQRREDGLIPGAIVLPRNSLEWRCDPASQWRHPAITRRDLYIILICHQGYQSSLGRSHPPATRPHPRHRPGRRIHRLGRSRPTRDRLADSRPSPIR